MRSNRVVQAYISGREVNLTNAQKELNKKYMEKYGIQ